MTANEKILLPLLADSGHLTKLVSSHGSRVTQMVLRRRINDA